MVAILFDHVLFELFNWFNGLGWFLKILVTFLGGGVFIITLFNLIQILVKVIGHNIYRHFPINNFTVITAFLLITFNVLYLIYQTWIAINDWNFWIVIEFLFTIAFITGLHSIFIPLREKKYL